MVKLLDKNAAVIGRPAGATAEEDRFPAELSGGTPSPLKEGLEAALGADRVKSRPLDLVRYASDASPYRFHPQVVVSPQNADDVAALLDDE